ncbi:pendrin-like isoform X1 [Silurus meridionalis]|nr:pendrin-like isoform X1 [Silurus meridionalis]
MHGLFNLPQNMMVGHSLSANAYLISRPIYSKRAFDEAHEKQMLESKTFKEKFSSSFRCSSNQVKPALKGLFPILDWLLKYPVKLWLPSDIISGASTGLVCCLQGLAYALLVSVAPVYGLYAAFFPILTYFFLGTSRHISVGPFPVTCLMVGSVVLTLAPDEHFIRPGNGSTVNGSLVGTEEVDIIAMEAERISIATTMTVLVGLFQLAMGMLHVGFLVRYLSDPLVGGFTTAAAFHVFISQLKMVLSVPTHSHHGFFSIAYTLSDVFQNIKQTNLADLVAGLLTIIIVLVVKEVNAKCQHKIPVPVPIEVIVTVIAAGISYAVDLKSHYGANIVDGIPRGFVPARFPSITLFGDIVGSSFSTAVVGYAVSISVAKVYATKHDYKIDGNQELIAFGISNIFCGCFSGFVATTALSRTAIQEGTGGKTQVAGLISALIMLIVIMGLGPLLQPLQKSVLAGIVIANLKGMFMQLKDMPILWRQNKTDCYIWVFTCISCIMLGLDVGLLTGIVFELGTVLVRTQFPSCITLGNIPGTDIYKNMKDYKNINGISGIKIFKCNSPIYFANIDYFKEQLRDAVGFDAVQVFKKRNKALKKIHKLVKKGSLKVTESGLVSVDPLGVVNEGYIRERDPEQVDGGPQQEVEDGSRTDVVVEVQVDWTAALPVNVTVPTVSIHSLVLDFSAVSFLDVMAAKSLKLVIKEFIRIGVSIYIAGCDDDTVRRMEALCFFDEVVTRDLLFLSVHDAILFIKLEMSTSSISDPMVDKISKMQDDKAPPPFIEDENQIETYDNQHLAIHELSV